MARDQIDMTPLTSRDELVAWLAAGVKPKVPQGRLRLVLNDIPCAHGLEPEAPVIEVDEIYFEEPAMGVRVGRGQRG